MPNVKISQRMSLNVSEVAKLRILSTLFGV